MMINYKKRILSIFTLLAVLLCTFSFAVGARHEKITAQGEAPIVKNNSVTAREKAIENAMLNAVKTAISRIISSLTIEENLQVLSENVYPNSLSYVESYKILDSATKEYIEPEEEERVGDRVETDEAEKKYKYVVTMETVISFERLTKELIALDIFSEERNLPRFVLFFSEKNIDTGKYEYFWGTKDENYVASTTVEDEIRKRFMEKGLYPADMTLIKEKLKNDPKEYGIGIDDPDAIMLTKLTKGEIIIVGKALTHIVEEIPGTKMKSMLANVNARILDTSGNVIATESTSEKLLHVDAYMGAKDAVKKAGASLADDLMEYIELEWGEEETAPIIVQLNLSGITKDTYLDIMQQLKDSIRGVSSIEHKSYTSGGIASLDIEIKGTSESFANELARSAQPEFSFIVTSFTDDSVDAVISIKEPKETEKSDE